MHLGALSGKGLSVGALPGRSTTRLDAKPPMFAGQLQRSRRCIASSGLEQSNIPIATSRVGLLRKSYTGVIGSKRKRLLRRKHRSRSLSLDTWVKQTQ